MNVKVFIPVLALLLLIRVAGGFAQEVLATAGSEARTNDVALTWTIGETMVESYQQNQHLLTQGFHQPLLKITSVKPEVTFDNPFEVYPNPARYSVNLSRSISGDNFTVVITNNSGQSVFCKQYQEFSGNDQIDLSYFSMGLYHLQIISPDGKTLQTFKIVKL